MGERAWELGREGETGGGWKGQAENEAGKDGTGLVGEAGNEAGIETGSNSLGMKLRGRARESGWERKHGNEAALEGQTDNEAGRARE